MSVSRNAHSHSTVVTPVGEPSLRSGRRLYAQLRPLGVRPGQLWTDRVVDEAAATADPVQLMRVFALSKTIAIKYVATAHPERSAIDPTRP
jgi:hypothetical protein